MSRGNVTDEGLEHLSAFTRLRVLLLRGTHVTDAGLHRLATLLPQLDYLDLSDTKITDVGVSHLLQMPRLESLDLSGTNVTDSGLTWLGRLEQLKNVSLMETQVTPVGIRSLREALPDLNVVAQEEE